MQDEHHHVQTSPLNGILKCLLKEHLKMLFSLSLNCFQVVLCVIVWSPYWRLQISAVAKWTNEIMSCFCTTLLYQHGTELHCLQGHSLLPPLILQYNNNFQMSRTTEIYSARKKVSPRTLCVNICTSLHYSDLSRIKCDFFGQL